MKPLKERIAEREQRRADAEHEAALTRKALLTVQEDVMRDLARQGDEELALRDVTMRETRKRVAAPKKQAAVNPFAKKVAEEQAAKTKAKAKKK